MHVRKKKSLLQLNNFKLFSLDLRCILHSHSDIYVSHSSTINLDISSSYNFLSYLYISTLIISLSYFTLLVHSDRRLSGRTEVVLHKWNLDILARLVLTAQLKHKGAHMGLYLLLRHLRKQEIFVIITE